LSRDKPPTGRWDWVPPLLSAVLTLALAIGVAIFFRVLIDLRQTLQLAEERLWIAVAGFLAIEAYLLRRAFLDGRRALGSWRRRESGIPSHKE
jgi:hypothetical protein